MLRKLIVSRPRRNDHEKSERGASEPKPQSEPDILLNVTEYESDELRPMSKNQIIWRQAVSTYSCARE